jgi:hypothetical protein
VRRDDNLTTFMCRLSRKSGASTSRNPKGLSRPVAVKLYLLYLLLLEDVFAVLYFGLIIYLFIYSLFIYFLFLFTVNLTLLRFQKVCIDRTYKWDMPCITSYSAVTNRSTALLYFFTVLVCISSHTRKSLVFFSFY